MKAVLVLSDMPENCADCKLEKTKDYRCPITGRVIDTSVRPFYCPIKDIPETAIPNVGSTEYYSGIPVWLEEPIEGSGE